MSDPLLIHRAAWIIPLCGPPIKDGAVALHAGKIVAAGRLCDVARSWLGARLIDHPDAVLLPGLINAHIHVELSPLAHIGQRPAPSSFSAWIEQLIAERAKVPLDNAALNAVAKAVLADQHSQGIAAVADISNTGVTRSLAKEWSGRLLCFQEYLGLRTDAAKAALQRIHAEPDEHRCTGHAIYSTHVDLLRGLKARANRLGHILPLHVAESAEEIELLRTGGGRLRSFLEERGVWDGSLSIEESGGAVRWLHRHGLLDSTTLCVHCVHVDTEEISLLAQTKAKVCLCPGSNRALGVGTAPLQRLLRSGIDLALGTDSLSSNPALSLWREMRLVSEEVAPVDALRMATLGGAAALGLADRLGSLSPGKDALVLAAGLAPMPNTATAVIERLIHRAESDSLHWL